MYRIIFLTMVLLGLLAQPVFIPLAQKYLGIYLDPNRELDFMIVTLKTVIMILCCFVMNELPWKPLFTKVFAMIICVVAIGLAYSYVNSIAIDDTDKTILVEQHDGREG